MNPDSEASIERIKHWIELAEEDLSVAQHSLTISSNVPYRIIAFHSQQCAEKYIKALLVFFNIDFPYTHDIEKLLEMTPKKFNLSTQLTSAGDLTDYAVAKRYPDYYQKLSRDESLNAIRLAEMVKEKITFVFNNLGYNFIEDPQRD